MLQSIHFKASLTTDAVRCDTPFNGTPLPIGFLPPCVSRSDSDHHTWRQVPAQLSRLSLSSYLVLPQKQL